MDFDFVSLKKAGGSVLLSAEDFLKMPIDARIELMTSGKVEFIKDGKILSADEMLAQEAGAAKGSYLAVLNNSSFPTKRMYLTSATTNLGKTGKQAGIILRSPEGCTLKPVDGASDLTLNGKVVPAEGAPLKNGDIIDVAGTRLQFYVS